MRDLSATLATDPIEMPSRRIDPLRATVAEWMLVPGIGPRLAERLVDARGHTWLVDLQEVKGIGPLIARDAAPHLVHPSLRSRP